MSPWGRPNDPRWRPSPDVVELLPDLDQQPPSDLEVRSDHGRHRLWFTAATDNVGIGPLIVSGCDRRARITMARAPTRPPEQRRQLARTRESGTGATTTPPTTRTGTSSTTSATSCGRRTARSSFATARAASASATATASRPDASSNRIRRAVFTGFCNLHEPGALGVDGGTSVGFSDRYHSRLDGQNVDITHVPAGDYTLVHKTNTQLLIRELRYSNNAASVAIRLSGPTAAHASACSRSAPTPLAARSARLPTLCTKLSGVVTARSTTAGGSACAVIAVGVAVFAALVIVRARRRAGARIRVPRTAELPLGRRQLCLDRFRWAGLDLRAGRKRTRRRHGHRLRPPAVRVRVRHA